MVELHCHTEGIVGPSIIKRLVARGLDFGFDLTSFEKNLPAKSMATWGSDYWGLVQPQWEQPDRLPAIVEVHVADLVRQGVEYVELMLANFHPATETFEGALERLQRFRQAIDRAAGGRIEVVFLVVTMRPNPCRLDEFAERVIALGQKGLVAGFAIAGNENACSIREWSPMIERVREAGLGIEIHAGEMAGPASVRDAIMYGRPDRIGHAVRAFEDDSLVAELKDRDIHIEFCPSCNVGLGVVPSIERHPIGRARDLGMNFSINTDDPGSFDCTMESEHALLARTFGFNETDFSTIRFNSLRSRFGGKRA